MALLTDCYLPRLGGIEVQVHDLARHLLATGVQVEVLTATASHRMRSGSENVDGVLVHRMALPLPGGVPVNPLAVPRMRRLLRDGGFDVAHAHMGVVSPFAMDAVRAALASGLPTAITWHCVHGRATGLMTAAGYAARWARRGAALSAVSEVAAQPVMRMSGGAPVAVLPNGIDPDQWVRGGARPGGPARQVRVVSAMRLALRKRPMRLLRMIAQVRDRLPGVDVRLELLGEGPRRSQLERAARDLGAAEWFTLPGRLTRPELRERYHDSDIYVAPATLEAFGIAALEARTAGLPVVAPRSSGVGEFVADGVNGLLAADDAGLVDAVTRLAGDEALRGRITAYNEQHPPKQIWPWVVARALDEYERAAGAHQ